MSLSRFGVRRYFLIIITVLLLVVIFAGCNRSKTYSVKSSHIKVDSLQQIVPLTSASVMPLLYTNVSGLERLPVRVAKEKFIAAVLPAILVAKHEIETLKVKLNSLSEKKRWNKKDSTFYLEVKRRFKGKDMDDLLTRVGTIPNSIVLAQAAVESGWGQSRFFLEGNNLFGVWSFKSDEQRMAAGRPRNGKRVYLRSYKDMSESIIHYYEILGSVRAYQSLREARLQTTEPLELLPHLKNFSERRTAYTRQLRRVVVRNDFTKFDEYQIDPEFLVKD